MYPALLPISHLSHQYPSPSHHFWPAIQSNPQKNTAVLPQKKILRVRHAISNTRRNTTQPASRQEQHNEEEKHQDRRPHPIMQLFPSPSCSNIPNTHIEGFRIHIIRITSIQSHAQTEQEAEHHPNLKKMFVDKEEFADW
jgi:hypothetical protein